MRYVVDASIAVKWLLPEEDSARADALLERFRRGEIQLIAPDVITAEIGNTLWKRLMKTKDISVAEASEGYADFLALQIPLTATSSLAERALALAVQENHPLYDTLYIALALTHGCKLVTADEVMVRKLGPKFPLVVGLVQT